MKRVLVFAMQDSEMQALRKIFTRLNHITADDHIEKMMLIGCVPAGRQVSPYTEDRQSGRMPVFFIPVIV